MNVSIKNEVKMVIFTAGLGTVGALVFWLFLFAVNKGTELIWDVIPNALSFRWYPVRMCFWLFFAAAIAAYVGGWRPGKSRREKEQ